MGRRFPIAYSGLIPVGKKCGNQRQGHLVSRIWRCTAAGISKQTAALGNFHASRLQCGPGYGQGMPLVPLNMLFLNRSHPHCGSRTSSPALFGSLSTLPIQHPDGKKPKMP